ncbi:coiled-coil domain-containing protein 34-like [Cyprinodon tularosa]|uniref:coiled-coil domain-containing protein 34-like n=1 Tax=Cyprinodon tularosa TaxID=77115 RepID=UPI0018E25BB2|nr:coiled-coil domain-containing protein 34-like [Cyprinodon tularosa]XP_038161461.1 coiled-coil domain-containing protein 34-like [Cyprinodon tularosa]
MAEGRMPKFPASASEGFSSTPVKSSQDKSYLPAKGLDNGVVSDDEDTFSLLSPIYHDSFDSDEEELGSIPSQQTSPRHSEDSRLCASPDRCELPRTPSKLKLREPVWPEGSPSLSAWETWLLSKAKEDRLRQEKKAEEERLLREKEELQEREREQKKLVMEEKIHKWLKVKREQERSKELVKQRREEEEMQRQQEKQKEIELKAQQKYKDWLQKKNQEKMEKEKKEKMEAALKEEQERERRRKAEEKFKDWLTKANEKLKASPKTHSYPTSPYDSSYPAPSFYNPIPWKPIHVPPPETSPKNTSSKKPQKQKKTPCTVLRQRNTAGTPHYLYRR